MSVCDLCDKEMSDGKADSCIKLDIEFPTGEKLPQSTYHFDEPTGRCHDCNIKHGGFHHNGCDVEKCPKCSGQLVSCGCMDVSEDEVMERKV